MSDRKFRVLVVTDDPEKVQLLEEAFLEIEETRFNRPVGFPCRRDYALQPREAVDRLRVEKFDVVLLEATAGSGQGLATIQAVRSQATEVPIVVLAPETEEAAALSLVRQGAQDYLTWSELDCLPLAHSVRCSIERHRLSLARRSISMIDDLTGFYSLQGFLDLSRRDVELCRRRGHELQITLLEWTEAEEEQVEMMTLGLAEGLRPALDETDLVGRVGEHRFAVLRVASEQDRAEPLPYALARLESAFPEARLQWGSAALVPRQETTIEGLLESAERSLCENRRVEDCAGRHL